MIIMIINIFLILSGFCILLIEKNNRALITGAGLILIAVGLLFCSIGQITTILLLIPMVLFPITLIIYQFNETIDPSTGKSKIKPLPTLVPILVFGILTLIILNSPWPVLEHPSPVNSNGDVYFLPYFLTILCSLVLMVGISKIKRNE